MDITDHLIPFHIIVILTTITTKTKGQIIEFSFNIERSFLLWEVIINRMSSTFEIIFIFLFLFFIFGAI